MKKQILSFLLIINAMGAWAQGIEFEHTSWKEIVQKAKEQNKPIFVDVYTSWCGPCKVMASTVFTKPEIGDKYNKGFINVKIDAEKGEGIDLAKKYEVKAYPTYLFINPADESLIGQSKSSMSSSAFGDVADKMLAKFSGKTEISIKEMTARFDSGNYDEVFLQNYIKRLKAERSPVSRPLEQYLNKYISEHPTNDQLCFLGENFNGGVKVYDYLVKNYKTIDVLLCKKDGLSAADLDRELMKEFDKPFELIGSNKWSKADKVVLLNKCIAELSAFVLNESKRDKKILETKMKIYNAINDSIQLLQARREFITRFVLPADQTTNINRTFIIIDKNAPEPVRSIDSASAAQGCVSNASLLLKLSYQKQDKELAIKLYKKAQDLSPASFYYTNAMNMELYNLGDKKMAIKQQTAVVKEMKKNNDEYLADAETLLQKMKNDEARVKFVAYKMKKKAAAH
ncbi:thioredoxin family protein [Solitalea lacus]|uniref:thioredoxin family protein n=1 Tax=Solitalea lacus TaxID=2911172 RepID=UPI001EDB4B1A|nr:thioredoxin family protein [Solitalea lacus]UKJ07672.1 thioredoxin family protein [Solitalea lacus]